MSLFKNGRAVLPAVLLTLALGVPAAAQTVTSTDIQRLQDEVYQAGGDVSRLRTSSPSDANRLQDELDALREDVIYLKVKLRRENSVDRRDYTDVRDRVQDLRARARGERGSRDAAPTSGRTDRDVVFDDRPRSTTPSTSTTTSRNDRGIPVGQEIDVRVQTEITSDTAQVEDRFEATTVVDLYEGDRVLIPAGSVMRGIVTSVNRASRTDRKGSLGVAFNQITVRGRSYPMRGSVTDAIESEGIRGEVGRIGAGSAVGAIIGGIIGGTKGALLGVLIGGGGTMVATEGKDVHVPPGTILRVRMDTPPEIR
jgi:hypothetical protein